MHGRVLAEYCACGVDVRMFVVHRCAVEICLYVTGYLHRPTCTIRGCAREREERLLECIYVSKYVCIYIYRDRVAVRVRFFIVFEAASVIPNVTII